MRGRWRSCSLGINHAFLARFFLAFLAGLAIGMASGAAALEAFFLPFFLAFFFAFFLAGAATAGAGAAFFALFFFFLAAIDPSSIFGLRNTYERNEEHFAIHVHAPSRSSLPIAIDCLLVGLVLSTSRADACPG